MRFSNGEWRALRRHFRVTGSSAVVTALVCGFSLGPVMRSFFPTLSAVERVLGIPVVDDTVLGYVLFCLSYSWNLVWALLGASIVLSYAMAHFRNFVSTGGIALATALVVGSVTGPKMLVVRNADRSMATFADLLNLAGMLLSFVTAFVTVWNLQRFSRSRAIAPASRDEVDDNPYRSPSSGSLDAPESPREDIRFGHPMLRHFMAFVGMFAGCLAGPFLAFQVERCPFAVAKSLAEFLLVPSMAVGTAVGLIAVSVCLPPSPDTAQRH